MPYPRRKRAFGRRAAARSANRRRRWKRTSAKTIPLNTAVVSSFRYRWLPAVATGTDCWRKRRSRTPVQRKMSIIRKTSVRCWSGDIENNIPQTLRWWYTLQPRYIYTCGGYINGVPTEMYIRCIYSTRRRVSPFNPQSWLVWILFFIWNGKKIIGNLWRCSLSRRLFSSFRYTPIVFSDPSSV